MSLRVNGFELNPRLDGLMTQAEQYDARMAQRQKDLLVALAQGSKNAPKLGSVLRNLGYRRDNWLATLFEEALPCPDSLAS